MVGTPAGPLRHTRIVGLVAGSAGANHPAPECFHAGFHTAPYIPSGSRVLSLTPVTRATVDGSLWRAFPMFMVGPACEAESSYEST